MQLVNTTFKETVETLEKKEIVLTFIVWYDEKDLPRKVFPQVESYEIPSECYIPCADDDYETFEKNCVAPLIGFKQLEKIKSKVTQQALENILAGL